MVAPIVEEINIPFGVPPPPPPPPMIFKPKKKESIITQKRNELLKYISPENIEYMTEQEAEDYLNLSKEDKELLNLNNKLNVKRVSEEKKKEQLKEDRSKAEQKRGLMSELMERLQKRKIAEGGKIKRYRRRQ
jgi:hypothetical protein